MKKFRCRFCNELVYEGSEEDLVSEEAYKRLVIHVWACHDEREHGRTLRETLEKGPIGFEEE